MRIMVLPGLGLLIVTAHDRYSGDRDEWQAGQREEGAALSVSVSTIAVFFV
jgi:hypothetical protein